MPFFSLPTELVLQVSEELSAPNLNALLRVNRYLALLLAPVLRKKIFSLRSTEYGTRALYSAAEREDEAALQCLLDEGILSFVGNGALLSDAVVSQSPTAIRTLLRCGVDSECRDTRGCTPLYRASQFGRTEVVELLLARKNVDFNPNEKVLIGIGGFLEWGNPLHAASRNGRAGVVRALLRDERVSLSVTIGVGKTPLHSAVSTGSASEAVMRLLLADGGVDINAPDSQGVTALGLAARDERVEVNVRGPGGRTPLHVATIEDCEATVRLLLGDERIEADPRDKDGRTPLNSSACYGYTTAARALLRDRREVAVKLLLADGRLNVNARDWYGMAPLGLSVWTLRTELAQILLGDSRVDVSASDAEGSAILHLAVGCQRGDLAVRQERMVKHLLADGRIDVNCLDGNCRTPLHCAVWDGPTAVVKLLADDSRVDVNRADMDGNTPLHLAITRSDEDERLGSVQALLGNPRTSTNLRDCNGDTPLHITARMGGEKVVQMLLSRGGTSLDIRNNNGRSVMDSLRSYSVAVQEAIA
ncbi:unnamed protein product [Tuber aestivum]|uniref:Uncharacterized protein n=1 Tax=Tuber aestivum TaxID=59557 RepID=A0A292PUM9_9PEZI|nr:unnamed protein product [Tuber aestivum]